MESHAQAPSTSGSGIRVCVSGCQSALAESTTLQIWFGMPATSTHSASWNRIFLDLASLGHKI